MGAVERNGGMKGEDMMRRTIAVLAGLMMLGGLAMLPTAAGAQSPPEITVLPDEETPTTQETTTTAVAPNSVVPTNPPPAVKGDVVSRPLPRTGNDIGGTAVFGGALTVLGIALALGARKRRNSFDGV